MHVTRWTILVLVAAGWVSAAAADEAQPVFDVPNMADIVIDGKADDWGDGGFRVRAMDFGELSERFVRGEVPSAEDFDPQFRLGWDDRGLLILFEVRDDFGWEDPDEGSLWRRDSMEIFLGEKVGSSNYCQLVTAPGIGPDHFEARHHFYNVGNITPPEGGFRAEVAATHSAGAYVCEVRLPWLNLGLAPSKGDEIGFQAYVGDSDGAGRRRALWYPKGDTPISSTSMHRVRLWDVPSAMQDLAATAWYEEARRIHVAVLAAADLEGKAVAVRSGAEVVGAGRLDPEGGRAFALISVPMPPIGETYERMLQVAVEDRPTVGVSLPDARAERGRAAMEAEIQFDPFVFTGAELPKGGFRRPRQMEEILGPHQIEVAYYNAAGEPVTVAEKPGRYGVVLTVRPERGRAFRRFCTLYRMDSTQEMWEVMEPWAPAGVELPAAFGVAPEVAREQARDMTALVREGIWTAFGSNSWMAVLLAGLHEARPDDPTDFFHGASARDRQWWVTFKRNLYGTAERFTEPFLPPRIEEGLDAPVLREGTLEEAGMKPGAADALDALLTEWADKSNEAFAVCVARHGVIVLHKAYGTRDGKPMTVTTPSWMASITKLLAANLTWQAVDQGLVGLDDVVGDYLPPLADAPTNRPLTIRDCYVHTAGLRGHWGDRDPDFEEMVAGYAPYLEVGLRHVYTGTGYALGSKVLEQVSGKGLPTLYYEHLFGPLGCTHTEVDDSGGGCLSVPLDMAKVAQMILNGGAYGSMRFFRPETLKMMLPEKLTKTLGPDAGIVWGIGCTWMDEQVLGEGAFGHGAASSATLRIVPEHDLVVVMTRNSSGSVFGEYHPKFLQMVVDQIRE